MLIALVLLAQSCTPPPQPVAPSQPAAPVCTAGNASAACSWAAPSSSGSGAITGYFLRASPGPATAQTSGVTSAIVSGLINGMAYTFTVEADNSACSSAQSPPSASVRPSAPVGQPSGTWVNVTPAGALTGYGAQDVIVHPSQPNVVYAFLDQKGAWRSTDYGQTFTKASVTVAFEAGGTPWGEAIASDGSYLIACSGYGPIAGAWRSTSRDVGGILDGSTWVNYSMATSPDGSFPQDVYNFAISPTNPLHVLAVGHNDNWLKESFDGGKTWAWRGNAGWSAASFVFFLDDATWLIVSDGSNGTWRTTNSGAAWARVGAISHGHGEAQIVKVGSVWWLAAYEGIFKSTDNGATWVSAFADYPWNLTASSIAATASMLYTSAGFPNGGSYGPSLHRAPIGGSPWSNDLAPSGMVQGAKRSAATFDGSRWYVIGGHWNAGLWRYAE